MDTYIPQRSANEKFRTLVVLLDGTGDTVDADVSNVVLLWKMLMGDYKFDDPFSDRQMVLYMRGIGSPSDPNDPVFDDETRNSWTSRAHRIYDQAFGGSMHERVQTSYRWLARNYRDGDKICIFGFSRGAYSARVLAGLINALGLLNLPENGPMTEAIKDAYDLYDDYADLTHNKPGVDREEDSAWLALQAKFQAFKENNKCREPIIEFVGCWDTVNSVSYVRSVGEILSREKDIKLGFTGSNDIVRNFRHAVALDEHRGKFKQSNWSGPPVGNASKLTTKKPRVETDAEEVWFAGCHCDIGGGSVPNGTRPNLAHISLRWMVRECFKKKTGMIFKVDLLRTIGIEPTTLYPIFKERAKEASVLPPASAKIPVIEAQGWGPYLKSWIPFTSGPEKKAFDMDVPTVSEDALDADDALAPAYDQLAIKPWKWYLTENIFLRKSKPSLDGSSKLTWEAHRYRGRTIPPSRYQHGGKIKVHRTVRMRMAATFENGEKKGEKYVPLARVALVKKGGAEGKITFEEAVKRYAASGEIDWVA